MYPPTPPCGKDFLFDGEALRRKATVFNIVATREAWFSPKVPSCCCPLESLGASHPMPLPPNLME